MSKDNRLDDLMLRIMIFVDRNGSIESKNKTGVSTSLNMKYNNGDFEITMHAFAHCMGNGSCGATVKHKGELVFDASGSYTSGPYHVKAKVYLPGGWEDRFPAVK